MPRKTQLTTMILCAGMTGALLSAGLAAHAAEEKAQEYHSEKARKALEGFVKTGKVENCVSTHRIDSTSALDDWTILFRMDGRKYYLNELPHRCAQLGFEDRFLYTLHGLSRLCNVDTITVLHSANEIPGPSCILGKFQELKKKTADAGDPPE